LDANLRDSLDACPDLRPVVMADKLRAQQRSSARTVTHHGAPSRHFLSEFKQIIGGRL
jgi:hypothetical protein